MADESPAVRDGKEQESIGGEIASGAQSSDVMLDEKPLPPLAPSTPGTKAPQEPKTPHHSVPLEDWEDMIITEVKEWNDWTTRADWKVSVQTDDGITFEKCNKAKGGLPACRLSFKIDKPGPLIEAYKYSITSGEPERHDINVKSSEVIKKGHDGRKIKCMHVKLPWPIWDRCIITASQTVARSGYFASFAVSCEHCPSMASFEAPTKTVTAFTRSSHEIFRTDDSKDGTSYKYVWTCQYDAKGIIPQSSILYLTGSLLETASKSVRMIENWNLAHEGGLESFKRHISKYGFTKARQSRQSSECMGDVFKIMGRSRSPSIQKEGEEEDSEGEQHEEEEKRCSKRLPSPQKE